MNTTQLPTQVCSADLLEDSLEKTQYKNNTITIETILEVLHSNFNSVDNNLIIYL